MVGIGLDVGLSLHPLNQLYISIDSDVLIKKDNTDTYNKSKKLYYSRVETNKRVQD
jgi:hypothetical protein